MAGVGRKAREIGDGCRMLDERIAGWEVTGFVLRARSAEENPRG